MAGQQLRFRHNPGGYFAVMKSDEVRANLQARADKVAAEAAPQYRQHDLYGDPVEVIADTYEGQHRAGATIVAVHPLSLRVEAKYRILGGAIDAAGG